MIFFFLSGMWCFEADWGLVQDSKERNWPPYHYADDPIIMRSLTLHTLRHLLWDFLTKIASIHGNQSPTKYQKIWKKIHEVIHEVCCQKSISTLTWLESVMEFAERFSWKKKKWRCIVLLQSLPPSFWHLIKSSKCVLNFVRCLMVLHSIFTHLATCVFILSPKMKNWRGAASTS